MGLNATSNAFWDIIIPNAHNWLELRWESYYEYMNNDVIATGLLLLVTHEVLYFGRSLPWLAIDMIPSMRKYKIQEKRIPTRADYIECLKSVLLGHIFVEAIPIFGFHYLCSFFTIKYRAPFPSFWTILWQVTVMFFMEDTWHYWGHRALHWKFLYKRFHKQHHKYPAPFGLTAEYAHPVEVAFTGTGTVGSPLLLAYFGSDVHLITIMTWIIFRLIQAVDSHSGYEFPISLHHFLPIWADAYHHDDHHRYFIGNYASSFRHWDYLLGTETPAFSQKRAQRKSANIRSNSVVKDPYEQVEESNPSAKGTVSRTKVSTMTNKAFPAKA